MTTPSAVVVGGDEPNVYAISFNVEGATNVVGLVDRLIEKSKKVDVIAMGLQEFAGKPESGGVMKSALHDDFIRGFEKQEWSVGWDYFEGAGAEGIRGIGMYVATKHKAEFKTTYAVIHDSKFPIRNKGAVAVQCIVNNKIYVFVSSHLSFKGGRLPDQGVPHRNAMFQYLNHALSTQLTPGPPVCQRERLIALNTAKAPNHCGHSSKNLEEIMKDSSDTSATDWKGVEAVTWMGDLNYRFGGFGNTTGDKTNKWWTDADNNTRVEAFESRDQLLHQLGDGGGLKGLGYQHPKFGHIEPSCKLTKWTKLHKKGSPSRENVYHTEKDGQPRIPSVCDRILIKGESFKNATQSVLGGKEDTLKALVESTQIESIKGTGLFVIVGKDGSKTTSDHLPVEMTCFMSGFVVPANQDSTGQPTARVALDPPFF
jgi:hypothetical protein